MAVAKIKCTSVSKELDKDINKTHFNEAKKKKKICVPMLGIVNGDEAESM